MNEAEYDHKEAEFMLLIKDYLDDRADRFYKVHLDTVNDTITTSYAPPIRHDPFHKLNVELKKVYEAIKHERYQRQIKGLSEHECG